MDISNVIQNVYIVMVEDNELVGHWSIAGVFITMLDALTYKLSLDLSEKDGEPIVSIIKEYPLVAEYNSKLVTLKELPIVSLMDRIMINATANLHRGDVKDEME